MVFLFQILIFVSILILLVGMIKPNWIMFWSDEPDRFMIMVFCILMFMGSFTGYGEFLKREREAEVTPVFRKKAPPTAAPEGKTEERQSVAVPPQ